MSASPLAEEFADVLESAIDGHRELLRVSRQEQQAIVHGEAQRVEELMWRKQQLSGSLAELQPRQQEMLRSAAGAVGLDPAEVTLTRLLRAMPRSAARTRLRDQRDELRLLASTLERTQRITTRLLLRAIQFADATMQALKAHDQENPIYAPAGHVERSRGERTLMDRMA